MVKKQQESGLITTYQNLHQLAERSGGEKHTSAYLKNRLQEAGFNVHSFTEHFGFYAEWPGETGSIIALRADMDALMQEMEGEIKANHACGHDAHSTMVLHTALKVAEEQLRFHHTLRFIFQPAEETSEGALQMMESGVLSNVVFLGGIHLRPETEVPNKKAAPVIVHGANVHLKGKVVGTPAHAARPEQGNNPIEAASEMVEAFKAIQIDEAFSFKVTEIHGGEAANSIPGACTWTFDIRTRTNNAIQKLMKKAEEMIAEIEERTKTSIEFEWEGFSPAAIKNEDAIAMAKQAITRASTKEAVTPPCESPGAEDFHFYTFHHPEISATMIGLGCGLKPGLHHPDMTFDLDALEFGRNILLELIKVADLKKEG